MTALKLRDYQRETIDALFTAWSEGMHRPAVVLPTGAGKTVVFSHLITDFRVDGVIKRLGHEGLGNRVIVLVHRDELADQAIAKIKAVAPHLSVGKVKAESNQIGADVMVCSVQTICRTGRLKHLTATQSMAGNVGLIITDECHHAPARSYQTVYDAFPDALHAGFTATLERGDGVGLGSMWDDVVYSRSPLWMMKHGYLVQPRGYTQNVGHLDLKSVKQSGGDYQSGDLGRALEESDLGSELPRAYKERAGDRPGIVFTPTVPSAQMVCDEFNAFGIPAAMISGETPREERLRIFEAFRLGHVQVLVNCMVLTEGFDAPWASVAVIARPTRSRSLYVQMVGRVLRPWKDKTDAIILNVSGAGGKLATLVDLSPGDVVEVAEGEGLLEAEEREAEEQTPDDAAPVRSNRKLDFKAVDLFAASHQAWLTTKGGVMFISAGEWTYFLWPSRAADGTWDVCRYAKNGRAELTEHLGLGVEMAMSWAEAEAEDHGSFSVSKKASWRRGKPSEAQVSFARGLGIDTEDMGKAEVSDAISVALTSRFLDPLLNRLT